MPYRLLTGEPLQDGIRRVVAQQIERSLGELADADLGRAVAIHQVRKRCKKIRAALRLVGGALTTYSEENAWYRDAARGISAARDTEALIETCDALAQGGVDAADHEVVTPIRARLEARRDALMEDPDLIDKRLHDCELAMQAGRERIASWTIEGEGYAIALAGLCKTYARGRWAMAAARDDPSTETFHEWRKRVKYHGYHMRLLREAWPAVVRARRTEAERLGELLGHHHDLGVLRAQVLEDRDLLAGKAAGLHFSTLVDQRLALVERTSWPLGRRLFAEQPKHLERRFATYVKAWSDEA